MFGFIAINITVLTKPGNDVSTWTSGMAEAREVG